VHGWPDLSFGWRYQVPFLLSLGLRVIVPDMLGYGRTDAPEAVAEYSMKKIAGDLAALVAHVVGPGERIILGGHDWGGVVVWKMAMWRPELVRAVFSVCTPYGPPRAEYVDLETMVRILPNFKYQLQLAGPDVEAAVVGTKRLRQFLNAMYGGRAPNGEAGFTTEGVRLDILDDIEQSPLLSAEEVDFYTDEYTRHGMHGPLNWYRALGINYEEEKVLLEEKPPRTRITAPSLIITASRDTALPPSMTANMGQHFDSLRRREVDAGHWALWQAAADVNKHIGEFLSGVLGAEYTSKL